MQEFQSSRRVFAVLGVLGWVSVAAGVFVALSGENLVGPAFALSIGVSGVILGFVIVGLAQIGKVQVVHAETTAQLLELMHKAAEPPKTSARATAHVSERHALRQAASAPLRSLTSATTTGSRTV